MGIEETAEGIRMADAMPWRRWGPYLAERAWGTVREDYSEDGDAWRYLPYDHARSRTFRWNEDGLGGICDERQTLCLAWSFWNGRDQHLKERLFGLDGHDGNHGEDAKEYWWFSDAVPSHAWMAFRYIYPIGQFPYGELRDVNRARTRFDTEFELDDSGVFDEGWWDIRVEYAKHDVDDIAIRVIATNTGATSAVLHMLPTLWFRNTWGWNPDQPVPVITGTDDGLSSTHDRLGRFSLTGPGRPLICNNETNEDLLFGVSGAPFPKDGINDHVVSDAATVDPTGTGTKGALWNQCEVEPDDTVTLVWRLSPSAAPPDNQIFDTRRAEADEYYAALAPPDLDPPRRTVLRQALSGLIWSKQFYHYDVEKWLDGDPGAPAPPPSRRIGRNSGWRHLNNADILAMPDTWEYPWFAAWDLGFQAVVFAHIDPEFAKHQLLLLCREWYQHPNGQLPAYEWAFGDVNPPVHAWAALRVFEIDGGRDYAFLKRVMHKLLLNFTWWVNRQDAEGNNVFEGGFLGMDNIALFDRSMVPSGAHLEQADGTAWMAMFCLDMLEMALVLAEHDLIYQDLATKFFEHFTYIASAINLHGLWSEEDGFYHDVLHIDGRQVPLRVRSMVGLLPIMAVTTLADGTVNKLPDFARRTEWFLANKPAYRDVVAHTRVPGKRGKRLLSIMSPERVRTVLASVLDEDEFLSPYGLRSMSARYRDDPYILTLGRVTAEVGYEPGESRTGLFGGNSNWRGPVWFPVNHLVIRAIRTYSEYFDENVTVECPVGSGQQLTFEQMADHLAERLISLFLPDASGEVPALAADSGYRRFRNSDSDLVFHEYFHGDTGAGLGASHQTGWTALVADLLLTRREQQRET